MTDKIPIYKLKKGTRVDCDCNDESTYIIFIEMDGMYGKFETEKGNIMKLGGSVFKDGEKYFL